jgi:hypothetical protein
MSKTETSVDDLLKICTNEKIRECISKLKVSKPNKSLFNKINKETLCDSLIFIAETLLGTVIQNDEIGEINESVLDMSNNPMSTQVEATKDDEEKEENSQIAEDNRPICKLFLDNRCPSGYKGRNCTMKHPKQCRKFLQGGRFKDGCQDWNCHLFHQQICRNSYLFGSCLKSGCRQRHTKTKQTINEEQEDHSSSSSSFLWKKKMEAQIDKITEMNNTILQAITQNHQRFIPVWDKTPQEQTKPFQPMWANNRQL